MKIENIDIKVIEDAFERIGKTELPESELLEFAKNTLINETKLLGERTKMFEAGEINEDEIGRFDFYGDGYRYGILTKINDDSLLTLEREKQDDGSYIDIKAKLVDDAGKRVRIVLRTRKGLVTVFLGASYFNILPSLSEKSENFIFIGGLTTKYKNMRTQKYDKVKDEDEEYSDFESYTHNLWQVVHIIRKGKSIELMAIEKPTENGD